MLEALAETHSEATGQFRDLGMPGTAFSMAAALLLFWKLNRTGIVDGLGSGLALWDELEQIPVACLLSPCWSGMRKQLAKHAALKHAADGRKEGTKSSLLYQHCSY